MARDGYVVLGDPRASIKKKTAVSRSWILLDCTGEYTILDVDKYAIMNRVQIHARDLRILDPLLSYPSKIFGRDQAIVLNLEHIKAIITAEEVLLRDPTDDNVIPIAEELRRRLPPANIIHPAEGGGREHPSGQNDAEAGEEESPFEFRALEVALEGICSFLDARTIELENAAYPALDELTSKISSRNLDRVLKLKSIMIRLTTRVQKVRDELEQLLNDDDDMADLYLSRKLAGSSSPVGGSGVSDWFPASPTIGSKISRASRASAAMIHGNENDVEELEMLLEMSAACTVNMLERREPPSPKRFVDVSSKLLSSNSKSKMSFCSISQAYFMQIDGTLNKLTMLREYIDDSEDYINIQLDNQRNRLIQVYLFLNAGILCLSICSLVTGIFGVSIPYKWNQNHGYLFKWVVIITGVACATVFILIVSYARYKGLVGS